jgi:hypothetical protein
MADLPPHPDAAPRDEPTTGAPRWVKASGVIAIVLIVLVVVLVLAGGGNHGPSRHARSTDGAQTAAASVETFGTRGHVARAGGVAPR